MKITSLPYLSSDIARTLIEFDSKAFEINTFSLRDLTPMEGLDNYTASAVEAKPFETIVFQLCSKEKPLSKYEEMFIETVGVNDTYRRDVRQGDLYSIRSATLEEAALNHDDVVQQFKSATIILMTPEERLALYGPKGV